MELPKISIVLKSTGSSVIWEVMPLLRYTVMEGYASERCKIFVITLPHTGGCPTYLPTEYLNMRWSHPRFGGYSLNHTHKSPNGMRRGLLFLGVLYGGAHPLRPTVRPLIVFTPQISASRFSLFDEKLSTTSKVYIAFDENLFQIRTVYACSTLIPVI